MRKVSAVGQPTRPTPPSIPLGVGKWVVIHEITWITGVETIKQQTRAACGCLVVGQSHVAAGLAYVLQAVRPLCLWRTTPLQLLLVALYNCYAFSCTWCGCICFFSAIIRWYSVCFSRRHWPHSWLTVRDSTKDSECTHSCMSRRLFLCICVCICACMCVCMCLAVNSWLAASLYLNVWFGSVWEFANYLAATCLTA